MADRIVKEFGDDTFRIMEEEPERLAEIKGISISKAMDIAAQLVDKRDMRKAMMFLQDYGINMNLANKIYSRYGQEIYTIIRQNPYRLAEDIEGIGFKMADDIASKAGIQVDSDFRVRSGILYILSQAAAQGHTYLPYEELCRAVPELLLIDIRDMDRHIMDMAIDKKIVVKTASDGSRCVYASMYYYMEASIARHLYDLNIPYSVEDGEINERITSIEESNGIELDYIQKEAVKKAVLNGLMIITGGPGTGKTTTINTIIKYFEMEGLDIRLAAPTGRAAKRMTETSGYEVNIMNSLLKAVAVGTRLILVGDVDQLPSVGPGNVLKDIIASGCFSVVKLEKIFRQAAESEIITNAHKINRGERVVLNKYSKDFLFVKRDSADAIISAMCTLLKEKLPDYVHADRKDIQILTPTRKSAVGAYRLNRIMQEYLNPPSHDKMEKTVGDTVYRVGDKVMQIKNNYQLEWEKRSSYGVAFEHGSGVFNGDMGVIEDINTFAEQMLVRFDDDRYVKYDFTQLDELELAYAITIHKSQGSEYPAVIIPMFTGPRMLMNRNLLYTAVTRARTCVCMVGVEDCFHQMAANESEQKRYSSLDVRIRELNESIAG